METFKIQKNEDLVEVIKCNTDEILFVRYDPGKDPEASAELIDAIFAYCTDYSMPCLFIPMSDDDVYLQLEQWELDRLRKLNSKLESIIKKKSPIILD